MYIRNDGLERPVRVVNKASSSSSSIPASFLNEKKKIVLFTCKSSQSPVALRRANSELLRRRHGSQSSLIQFVFSRSGDAYLFLFFFNEIKKSLAVTLKTDAAVVVETIKENSSGGLFKLVLLFLNCRI